MSESAHALILCMDSQLNEQLPCVGSDKNQRWLWVAPRKPICFSKSERMHDMVIGLYINENFF